MKPILCILALLAFLPPCLSAGEAGPAPTIGVLNIDAAYQRLRLVRQRNDENRSSRQKVEAEKARLATEIKNLKAEVDVLSPEQTQYHERLEQLEILRVRATMSVKRLEMEAERLEAKLILDSYNDIRKLIAEFAAERQLAMILIMLEPDIRPDGRAATTQTQIAMRGVLYIHPSMNITDAFIAFADTRTPAITSGPVPPPAGASPQ